MLGEHQHVSRFGMLQVRIEHDRAKRGQNPRPGTQGIMRDVEPQDRKHPLAFVFGAEDSLGDISAATWLRAGIPERPPLQAEEDQKRDHRESPPGFCCESLREIREEVERIAMGSRYRRSSGGKSLDQGAHTSDVADAVVGDRSHHTHLEDELK